MAIHDVLGELLGREEAPVAQTALAKYVRSSCGVVIFLYALIC